MADESGEAAKGPSGGEGSVKETIEAILIAFILAFVFRAFVVEAFVIPTGSMGPTLMGAHMRLTCPDCGYQFNANFSSPPSADSDDLDIPAYSPQDFIAHCPNCGYTFKAAAPVPVYFGDRILVLKYRYLFSQPDRWDVVVFKSPYEKRRDPDDPKYPDNYIKRLVGKPGEAVMILDGDVYIGKPGIKPQQFEIQRKPPRAQVALWRTVYDNDYLPHLNRGASDPWQQPWTAESGKGWNGPRDSGGGGTSRIFRFRGESGAAPGVLQFDSGANPPLDMLSDALAYDEPSRGMPSGSGAYVSDLKLSCVYRRHLGSGPLRMLLTKRDDCFTADFTPGKLVLCRWKIARADPLTLASAPVWRLERAVPELSATDRDVQLDLINLDYRVSVNVNGREIVTTDDRLYSPDVAALLREFEMYRSSAGAQSKPIVRMAAQGQECSIEHLKLSRDIYYLNTAGSGRYTPSGTPSGLPLWASPEQIQVLGPDEYFVLGDNSLVSLDARFWGAPVDVPGEGDYHVAPGRVPGRFMLGKAFFVYWPAGYRPGSLPYGVEPDFGDMRFIH